MPCPFRMALTALALVAAGCVLFLEFFWDKDTLERKFSRSKLELQQNNTKLQATGETKENSANDPHDQRVTRPLAEDSDKQSDEFPQSKCPYTNAKYALIKLSRIFKSLSPSIVLFGLGDDEKAKYDLTPKFRDRPLGFKIAYTTSIVILIVAHVELLSGGYTSKMIRNSYKNGSMDEITYGIKVFGEYLYGSFQPLIDVIARPFISTSPLNVPNSSL